jgi:hypothetical protein
MDAQYKGGRVMIKFDNPEDKLFFEKLFCRSGELIETYASYFDFRVPRIKKEEFDQIRDQLTTTMTQKLGDHCALSFHHICNPDSGMVVDHYIPLSSNELNKNLRKMKPSQYKLVPVQSFGSNHIDNLILVCENCYRHRKHRFVRLIQNQEENTHEH